ncbi:exported hypothetical protein [Parafrankia sp. Ea1.12]|nr:exported hypothetical protein [Parafrankia sp. Ea1.12]
MNHARRRLLGGRGAGVVAMAAATGPRTSFPTPKDERLSPCLAGTPVLDARPRLTRPRLSIFRPEGRASTRP